MLHQLTKNFHYIEFASKDGSPLPEHLKTNLIDLATNLQIIRDYLGVPIKINSGYRSPEHNKKVGGSSNSYHLKAMASDIRTDRHTPEQLKALIKQLMDQGRIKKGGLKAYNSFVHYDIRGVYTAW